MDSARLSGSGRADSSPCPSRENGNPGGPTKDRVTRQGECGRNQRVIRYQPVIAAKAAIQRASVGDRLYLLDARLMGRFPLMPLAWIPAYAGMTWVEGTWALIMLVRQLNRRLTILHKTL